MTRRSTDPDTTEDERGVLLRLEETGWFVNTIAPDERGPGFAYSFGLYETFRQPEIIMFGLPMDIMQQLMNNIGEAFVAGGNYEDGSTTSELLDGFACRFRLVNPGWYGTTLTWATWFYRGRNFPALQMFWPDKAGHFPWEPACSEGVRSSQPDLSIAPKQQ